MILMLLLRQTLHFQKPIFIVLQFFASCAGSFICTVTHFVRSFSFNRCVLQKEQNHFGFMWKLLKFSSSKQVDELIICTSYISNIRNLLILEF